MKESRAFDPDLHAAGTVAAAGGCSYHRATGTGACAGPAVVSFRDEAGGWESGCATALQELVEAGDVEPFGQGA